MKLSLSVLLFVILGFSCHQPKADYQYPGRREIIDIIETIIKEKKLSVVIDTSNHWGRPMASDLDKLVVLEPMKLDSFQPPSLSKSIENLMTIAVNGKRFFIQDDSDYILSQNKVFKHIDLAKEFTGKYYLTTTAIENKRTGNYGNSYYSFSVPIFSKDMKRVYIELDDNCRGLCGSGGYFLLEKVNYRWKIITYKMLWIS
jgi:hypothetical protein